MNEPLITLCDKEDGQPIRRFAEGEAPHGGGAARPSLRDECPLARDLAQRTLSKAAEFGHAAAVWAKAGLSLARRR